MNTIYIVYECDSHRSYDSVVIKYMTTAKVKAKAFYNYYKQNYVDDSSWFFNLGYYEMDIDSCSDESNAVRDIDLLISTETINEY